MRALTGPISWSITAVMATVAALIASYAAGGWLRVLPPATLVSLHWFVVCLALAGTAALWGVFAFADFRSWRQGERVMWRSWLTAAVMWTAGVYVLGFAAVGIARWQGWLG